MTIYCQILVVDVVVTDSILTITNNNNNSSSTFNLRHKIKLWKATPTAVVAQWVKYFKKKLQLLGDCFFKLSLLSYLITYLQTPDWTDASKIQGQDKFKGG